MAALLSGIWTKIVAGLAIVGSLLLLFFKIRESGEQKVQNENLQQELKNVKDVSKVNAKIDATPSPGATNELRSDWERSTP